MKKGILVSAALALLGAASLASAQSAPVIPCPELPSDAGLAWEYKASGGIQFCRALRSDGTEAFGLYIAKETPFKPTRYNRAEEAVIDGRPGHWYRSAIANRPEVQARETVVTLPDGRVAYVWIQARSEEELGRTFAQVGELRFSSSGQLTRK